jgi:aldehyde dehydrogenase (NAD(P)+)
MSAPRPKSPPETDPATLDRMLAELHARRDAWAAAPIARRLELLDGLRTRAAAVSGRWVAIAAYSKGIPIDSQLRGEEWASGPLSVINYLNRLRRTLEHVAAGTLRELVDGRVRRGPDGRTIVRVIPAVTADRLLLSGFEVDVWMRPGVPPDAVPDRMAGFYRRAHTAGGVALVLGAGNISAIPPLDVLYKLFAEGRVVILKMNPINSSLGAVFEEMFEEFVREGFVRFAYGGAEVGRYLVEHETVEEIHLTGSAATHDAIVFGVGEEGRIRKERDEPRVVKPVTSELGGVGPVVVLPGPWSDEDLAYQAENVASMKMHNAGFNCIAGQVLVLPDEWSGSDPLIHAVRKTLREISDRPAYYPGADERMEAVSAAYAGAAERLGPSGSRLLIPHVPHDREEEHAFGAEFFGGALAVTRLPGGGEDEAVADYLDRAVDFCNRRLYGSLGMSILVHPRTAAALGSRLEEALGRLRYGTIGINVWSGAGFLIAEASWGAYPGHSRNDIQSGAGVVHNALLFDEPEKTVVRGPFAPFPRSVKLGERHGSPKPFWFVTHRTAERTARLLTEFAATGSRSRAMEAIFAAYRG